MNEFEQTNEPETEAKSTQQKELPTKEDLASLISELDQIDIALANFNQVE